jgi:hypothetical protein
VRVGRQNQRQHRHLLYHPIAGNTFGNRTIAVKVSVIRARQRSRVDLGRAGCHANGRKRSKALSNKQPRRVGSRPGNSPFGHTARRVAAEHVSMGDEGVDQIGGVDPVICAWTIRACTRERTKKASISSALLPKLMLNNPPSVYRRAPPAVALRSQSAGTAMAAAPIRKTQPAGASKM